MWWMHDATEETCEIGRTGRMVSLLRCAARLTRTSRLHLHFDPGQGRQHQTRTIDNAHVFRPVDRLKMLSLSRRMRKVSSRRSGERRGCLPFQEFWMPVPLNDP